MERQLGPMQRKAIEHVGGVLAAARLRHSAEELSRVEEAFAVIMGHAPEIPRAPLQGCQFMVPRLRAVPWHDASSFPAAGVLEREFSMIREEWLERGSKSPEVAPWIEESLVSAGKWTSLLLRNGSRTLPGQDVCPKTSALVSSLPGIADMAMFSILAPDSHISPHSGHWNCRITIHLGLVIPAGCEFRVGAETRSWQEGRCLAFDDGFEHEVWHRGKTHRTVLLVDVWHPDLTALEIDILRETLPTDEMMKALEEA